MKECHETITVFNARMDGDKGYDIYVPTVIHGVSWFCEIASNVDSSGLKAANKFIIRVPVDADFSGKAYAPPVAYAGGDPNEIFTLKQGDIIDCRQLKSRFLFAIRQKIVTIHGRSIGMANRAGFFKPAS